MTLFQENVEEKIVFSKVLLKSAFIFVTETNPGKSNGFMYYMISHIKKAGYLYISVTSIQS